jgi:hypothetical protein
MLTRTRNVVGLLLLLAAAGTVQAQTADQSAPTPLAAGGPAPTGATPEASPVPANIEDYVRSQTKGGELDFDKLLATKKQTMFLHDGGMYNKHQYALVLWGMRVKALGIASAERACAVYAQASNRPLSAADKQALVSGFDSGTRE